MAARKTRKTGTKVSSLKPKTLSTSKAKRVKGGGWDVKGNKKY
jgi:hypothetical protein